MSSRRAFLKGTAVGSVYEFGTLAGGERLYVYDDSEFLTVPGKYAGLTYPRPEKEDNDIERPSGYRLELTESAEVFVAYDAESTPDWTDTGDSIGTDDGIRRVFKKSVDAGTTRLGHRNSAGTVFRKMLMRTVKIVPSTIDSPPMYRSTSRSKVWT